MQATTFETYTPPLTPDLGLRVGDQALFGVFLATDQDLDRPVRVWVKPSDGLQVTPRLLQLSPQARSATFGVTAAAVGRNTLRFENDGDLRNPPPVEFGSYRLREDGQPLVLPPAVEPEPKAEERKPEPTPPAVDAQPASPPPPPDDGSAPMPPEIVPNGGPFTHPVTVELRCEIPACEIWYTLNGADPGVNEGYPYVEPFVVHKNTMVRAVAVRNGLASQHAVARFVKRG